MPYFQADVDKLIKKIKGREREMNFTHLAETHQEKEIQKLMMFLVRNYPGELNGDKSPIDVAIELLKERGD